MLRSVRKLQALFSAFLVLIILSLFSLLIGGEKEPGLLDSLSNFIIIK